MKQLIFPHWKLTIALFNKKPVANLIGKYNLMVMNYEVAELSMIMNYDASVILTGKLPIERLKSSNLQS